MELGARTLPALQPFTPCLGGEARLDGARVANVALQVDLLEGGVGRAAAVKRQNVPRDGLVDGGVHLVHHHVQQVEAREDRGGEVYVVLQRLALVIAPPERVGGGQDGGPRVERGLTGLGWRVGVTGWGVLRAKRSIWA